MPLKSPLELFIVLLYANNKEKIEGITRLVKLMFLLVKEGGFSQFEKELDFESYHYGPLSVEVFLDYPKTLEEIGIVKIEEKESTEFDVDEIYLSDIEGLRKGKLKVFHLTKDGEKVAKTFFEQLTEEEKNKVEEIKKRWNNTPLKELCDYVYFNYVEYTNKSKIRTQVFSKLKVSPSLIKLIGIIPPISLEKEKEIIRRAIREMITK